MSCFFFFCFKQKTAYEMRISDWSSDVCSSDLRDVQPQPAIEKIGLQAHFIGVDDLRIVAWRDMPRWTIERPDIEKVETTALVTAVVAYITHHTGTKLLIERQAPSQLVFAKRVAEGIRGHAKIDRPHFQLFRRPAQSAGN